MTQEEIITGNHLFGYVFESNPDSISFVLTERDEMEISSMIDGSNFGKIMLCYGYKFLLALLDYFERTEQYEKCAAIKKSIELHNEMVNDSIPTRMV